MSRSLSNSYSGHWFEFFPIAEARTRKEVEFVSAVAPLPAFGRVLDICCGTGRHARELAARGYNVTGIERDAGVIATARARGGAVDYVQADIQDYRPSKDGSDLIIAMSQSFGYFDEATNRDLLGRWASGLRKGGRMILDLWDPEFFIAHQGEGELQTANGVVHESRKMRADRLFVHLTYPDGADDNFEWQLFSPEQIKEVAEPTGLRLLATCRDYRVGASNFACPKIQFVLEKR